MFDDDMFAVDVAEVSEAILASCPQPTITPIEDLTRIDVFRGYRNKHDLSISAIGLPWMKLWATVLDYYRPRSGWMIFLEKEPESFVVRLRHEDQLTEPSTSKQGVTLTWCQDQQDVARIQSLVDVAIEEDRSPLYDLLLANQLPDVFANPLREQLPSPLNTSLTVAGDLVFPARPEILRQLLNPTIYLRHPT